MHHQHLKNHTCPRFFIAHIHKYIYTLQSMRAIHSAPSIKGHNRASARVSIKLQLICETRRARAIAQTRRSVASRAIDRSSARRINGANSPFRRTPLQTTAQVICGIPRSRDALRTQKKNKIDVRPRTSLIGIHLFIAPRACFVRNKN